MSPLFDKVTVVGLGLLGGSVALAARQRGVARTVVASGRRPEAHAEAVDQGVVDASLPLADAVAGADLVILTTPIFAMADTLRRAAPHLARGALVTDVGSVKGGPAESLPGILPEGVEFVGSHPMAGSHLRGVEHARADLFEGAACVVTPTATTSSGAVARIEAFWRSLGARVLRRDPAAHDEQVAWVSHLPHALAFAYARALADEAARCGELAGSGFRDFTRIAWSDPELWGDILCANRKALAGPLQRAGDALSDLARALEANDVDAVERQLAEAREALDRAAGSMSSGTDETDARSGGENPEIQKREKNDT